MFLALGAFGYQVLAGILDVRPRPAFGHGVEVAAPEGRTILCSYHVSQQNTFTGKLTPAMLDAVLRRARAIGGRGRERTSECRGPVGNVARVPVEGPRVIAPRRRRLASLAGAVVSLALVSGCAGQRAPTSYTDSVKKNFITGCTTVSTGDAALGTPTEANQYCTCVFTEIKKNVKFSEFKKINDDLTQSGGGPLPSSFQDAYTSCQKPTG